MGMYTQLVMGCSIKPDKYSEIKEVLDYMLGNIVDEPKMLPEHPLFKTDRWRYMLRSDSHYFDFKTHSELTTYDYTDSIHLTIITNLKNYSDEIEKFIEWISIYLDNYPGEFLGFMRYEEDNSPTIIYLKEQLNHKQQRKQSGETQ